MLVITFSIPADEFEADEWEHVIVRDLPDGISGDDRPYVAVSQGVVNINGGPNLPTVITYTHGGTANVADIQGLWSIS